MSAQFVIIVIGYDPCIVDVVYGNVHSPAVSAGLQEGDKIIRLITEDNILGIIRFWGAHADDTMNITYEEMDRNMQQLTPEYVKQQAPDGCYFRAEIGRSRRI